MLSVARPFDNGAGAAGTAAARCWHPMTLPHTATLLLPRRPHLVAAATNTGAVLLSFDTNERPPVVALPAQVG